MKLFIPGPIWCRDDLLLELAKQPIGHRSPQFAKIYGDLLGKLKKILFTEGDVHVSTSSGSGVWELAIRNCVRKKALVCECGAFSTKWGNAAEMNGRETVRISVDWGKAIKPEMVADALDANPDIDAVLFCHNETSTGITNPIAEIAEIIKQKDDVLFLVDAVSSMSAIKLEVDKLGIDIALASTQKAWGIPPGAAVFTASDRAYARAETIKNRGYYFDLLAIKKNAAKNQTLVTPAIPHIYGLAAVADSILAEGLENRFNRHKEMAELVRTWARKHFALFAEEGYESDSLTCIANTKGIDIKALNAELLANHDCVISDGYGAIKGKTFRIAHMGDMQVGDLSQLLQWIDEILGL